MEISIQEMDKMKLTDNKGETILEIPSNKEVESLTINCVEVEPVRFTNDELDKLAELVQQKLVELSHLMEKEDYVYYMNLLNKIKDKLD